ncbi:MAG: tRNA lysidine(34) synthetase TilS [Alkalilacustris sp.]
MPLTDGPTDLRAGGAPSPSHAPDALEGTPAEAVAAALAGLDVGRLGVAVSGGGDSVALLLLLADWAGARGVVLEAATVDHGLRPGSGAEAEGVAVLCARLGVAHSILRWEEGTAARGNLQDAARRARLGLLAGWAGARSLGAVALGHTRDDQAETVLMRLARGAGVDGLSAMAVVRRDRGVTWLRPLLALERATLRRMLRARGVPWVEDPSNADPRFLRVRTRRVLEALAPLGIDAAGLAATAERMAQARAALGAAAARAAARLMRVEAAGDVVVDLAPFLLLPAETQARLLGGTLRWVGAAEYPPRRAALERALGRIAAGADTTLGGCVLRPRAGVLRIGREWRAVRGRVSPCAARFDGRWLLHAPEGCTTLGLHVAPLGPGGLAACPNWRATGSPRAALAAGPAVWAGPSLVAAPLAGLAEGWRAELAPPAADFPSLFILH